ncbi:hypothetical protein QJQ45_007718 [Haematococcus lacustris]|nr:hypothetical protein QJQ45_007718 [Haematococcus lacustris]
MQQNRQRKRNRDASDCGVDRELEAQPQPSQAQQNKQASGEARWDRHNSNSWHSKKCKLHTLMTGVSAAGLERGAVVASEVVEARLVTQIEAWVKACSMRALLASLLFGHMVRSFFTRVTVLPGGQEAFEDIPALDAVIPNLADRNLFLQLGRGIPPVSERSKPSEAVVDVLTAYPDLHASLDAVPRYPHDRGTVDDVGRKLETNFANSLTELFLRRGKEVTWLQGAGGVVPTPAMREEVARQRRLLGPRQGVVVDKAWLERKVNRGRLLRHAVDTSRQLEAAQISWQADWADWQAAGGQRNTRPYRPPSPSAITPGCSCKAHYYRQSGITEHAKVSKVWMAGIKPQHDELSQVTNYTVSLQRYREYSATTLATWPAMWAELSKRRWSNARFRLYGGKQRTVAKFWAETVKGAMVRCNSAATGRPLSLAYGAAGFSGSGSIGSKGVPVKQMLREACKQFPGRVVLVHEFRTSRVISARTNVVQGQAESFRWLHPVRSMAKRSRIRGLMCSTSNVIKRRFYDRDVSAALNIRRIAAGPGRPRELSSWLGRPAVPNPGRPGQEWVLVRDKGLLRKWQRRHQRQR